MDRALNNACALFGLQPGCSREEVDKAYRKLALRSHPDKQGNSAVMQELNAARDLLRKHVASTLDWHCAALATHEFGNLVSALQKKKPQSWSTLQRQHIGALHRRISDLRRQVELLTPFVSAIINKVCHITHDDMQTTAVPWDHRWKASPCFWLHRRFGCQSVLQWLCMKTQTLATRSPQQLPATNLKDLFVLRRPSWQDKTC